MTPTDESHELAAPPPPVTTTVRPGDLVPMFEIRGGKAIERELVDAFGRPCNSVGGPLPVAKKKGRKKK